MGSQGHRGYYLIGVVAVAMAMAVLLFPLPSSTAVPTSRSFNTAKEHPHLALFSHHFLQMKNEVVKMEGRMNIEVHDYSGTGPNHNHDPKTPPARV